MRGVLKQFAIYMAVYVLIDQAVPGLGSEVVGAAVNRVLLTTDWTVWALSWAWSRI